jgi:hypothetical protein
MGAKDGFHNNKVRVLSAGAKGRGVFARGNLVEGECIEFAPVVVLRRGDEGPISKTVLRHHVFDLGRGLVGVGLGFASLYNHSFSANADFEASPAGIRIVAQRAIGAGEEITLDYRWSEREFRADSIPRHS